jgi:hypothetical protein
MIGCNAELRNRKGGRLRWLRHLILQPPKKKKTILQYHNQLFSDFYTIDIVSSSYQEHGAMLQILSVYHLDFKSSSYMFVYDSITYNIYVFAK